MDEKQIEVENLSFIYENMVENNQIKENNDKLLVNSKSDAFNSVKVLENINLEIFKGKFIALLGNTGSGKSTLVRTFDGLIPHFYHGKFYGYVRVFGKDTVKHNIRDLSKHVGLVFQNPENQLVTMSVEREIAFGLENLSIPKEIIEKKIDDILNYLKITHLRKRHPYELSGGEKQRVAIASILVLEPDIIILDEPTSALDPKAALEVLKLLKIINSNKKITIIIIEHRLDMILPFCDEIILMKDGKILDYGPIEKILANDNFYDIGIEVPDYINIFQRLKKNGYIVKFPRDIKEAAQFIGGFIR